MADKKVLRIFTGEEDDQWDLKKIFLIVVIRAVRRGRYPEQRYEQKE